MYNGRPAEAVVADRGARTGGIDLAHEGVVTRGVLLDIPRARGVRWLEDGEGVDGDDLERAEEQAGTRVEPGDVLYVRTGYGARRPGGSADMPGLTANSLEFIHARQPAIVATDSGTDAFPSGYPSITAPVHCVSMVAMGIWIIDNCDLEHAARRCAELERWHFMTTINPLRLKNSTGSPVNPIAVF
jgi:kynurenine formamidase